MRRDLFVEMNALNFYRRLPKDLLVFPLDISKIIELTPNCNMMTYQTFSQKHGYSISKTIEFFESEDGCTLCKNGKFIIMYNDSPRISKPRKEFTKAHEFGHIFLNHFRYTKEIKLAYSSNSIKGKTFLNQLEKEADLFANIIRSPIPLLYKIIPQSVIDVQRIFGISIEASHIVWDKYNQYDEHDNLEWHYGILETLTHINNL